MAGFVWAPRAYSMPRIGFLLSPSLISIISVLFHTVCVSITLEVPGNVTAEGQAAGLVFHCLHPCDKWPHFLFSS
jgi:hypothetical protein